MPGILSLNSPAQFHSIDSAVVNRFDLLSGDQAIAKLGNPWRELQRTNPALSSPYYSLEFASAVSTVRPFETVALYANNTLVGLWPFHRLGKNRGIPLASTLNDYHGPLALPNIQFDPKRLLAASNLSRLDFHSLAWPQDLLQDFAFHQTLDRSWIEFGGSPELYLNDLRARSTRIVRHAQKTRRCERELGPLRLEFDCRMDESINWVIEQKRKKYWRTGCTDFFQHDWTRNLLFELARSRGPSFRAYCSVLYAGKHRIAAHFGIAQGNILHYWYPVYAIDYAKHSPGLEMFLRIVSECQNHGIGQIDFGYGDECYKRSLATNWGKAAVGSIEQSRVRFLANRLVENSRLRVKHSYFRSVIRDSLRLIWPQLGKPKIN